MANVTGQGLQNVRVGPYFAWPHFTPSTASVYLMCIQCLHSERNEIKI